MSLKNVKTMLWFDLSLIRKLLYTGIVILNRGLLDYETKRFMTEYYIRKVLYDLQYKEYKVFLIFIEDKRISNRIS